MARPEIESRREESSWTSGAQSSWEARCRHPQPATGLRVSARETVSSCCLESRTGNTKRLDFDPAPDITLVSSSAGIEGGAALWNLKQGPRQADFRWDVFR